MQIIQFPDDKPIYLTIVSEPLVSQVRESWGEQKYFNYTVLLQGQPMQLKATSYLQSFLEVLGNDGKSKPLQVGSKVEIIMQRLQNGKVGWIVKDHGLDPDVKAFEKPQETSVEGYCELYLRIREYLQKAGGGDFLEEPLVSSATATVFIQSCKVNAQ